MRCLPRDGGGAEGLVHDGHARRRAGPRSRAKTRIHRVSLAKPFAVGRFTISFDEWDACLADGGCGRDKGDDKGFGRGRMPAQGINFVAAKSYLAWLSKKVGRTYRLPSESEREYFTRAGTSTPFWFGNTITAQDANYKASIPYGAGPRGADSKGPAVVDSYPPTRSACIRCTATCSNGPRIASTSATTKTRRSTARPGSRAIASERMLRGGTWDWMANMVRAGYRENGIVDGGGYSFRVVRR